MVVLLSFQMKTGKNLVLTDWRGEKIWDLLDSEWAVIFGTDT